MPGLVSYPGGVHVGLRTCGFDCWSQCTVSKKQRLRRGMPSSVRWVSPRILWSPKIPKPATVRNTTFFVNFYHKEHIFQS